MMALLYQSGSFAARIVGVFARAIALGFRTRLSTVIIASLKIEMNVPVCQRGGCPIKFSVRAKKSLKTEHLKLKTFSQPLFNLLLILVVKKSQHEQHEAEREEAEDAIQRFQFPHVEDKHPAERGRQQGEADPAIHAC